MFLRSAATPLAVICASLLVPAAVSAQAAPRPKRPTPTQAQNRAAPPAADPAAPAAAAAPATPAPAPAPRAATPEQEAMRRQVLDEVENRLDAVKEEIRDEVRAAVTSANAAQSWDEEFAQTRPELEFFEAHGYFRTRMELFDKFDLGQSGHGQSLPTIYPTDPVDSKRSTNAFADLRLRFEPTLNVSEEVRIKAQIDMLDNVILGSTPDHSSRSGYVFLSEGQRPPQYGVNSWTDSIEVKRAWAEVRTPFGELRFGRMGTHWGLGVLANDGNCLDCDHGDTVDRILFATKIADHVIAPAIDFVSEGVTTGRPGDSIPTAQPIDASQLDDARDLVLAIARKDDDEEMRKKRLAGQETFVNYGLYFVYRTQKWDAPSLNAIGDDPEQDSEAVVDDEGNILRDNFIPRDAWAVIPDLWFRLVHKSYRLELELVTVQGEIGNWAIDANAANAATQNLSLEQYGGALQNEFQLLDGDLALGLELGYASGDPAYGFGNFPGRTGAETSRGDWEGPQYACKGATCSDNSIQNFRFDRDYRVDMILFREILGGVTDATYVKPSLRYDVTEGLNLNLAIIYSQANEGRSTPTGDKPLGVEVDAGILYRSEDNFVAGVRYGVLFPMSGLDQYSGGETFDSSTAQAVRGIFAVTY